MADLTPARDEDLPDRRTSGRESSAIRLAIANALFGLTIKLSVGFFTGSLSMISSGVDSLGDLFVSIANLFVVRYADTPPDEDHNYGHAKVEGLGAMFEGGFIAAAGAFLIFESGRRLLYGGPEETSWIGASFMVPVLLATVATVWFMTKVAKETGSLVVRADALHYQTDVWTNTGVLVSLVVVRLTGWWLVDPIVSLIIAVSMIVASFHVVSEGFGVVMDRSLEPDQVEAVRTLIGSHALVHSFHDLKTRGGKVPHVDFHVVVPGAMTTRESHDLYVELRDAIRARIGPTTRVLMHADPLER